MTALRTLAFLALIGVCSSQTSDCSYQGLLEHLNLTASNEGLKITRPVKNWTSTTLVHVKMFFYGILDVRWKSWESRKRPSKSTMPLVKAPAVRLAPPPPTELTFKGRDEKSQTASVHISVHMFWTNEFLTWNSSEFCGIDAMTLPRSVLWIPDIAILQDASDSSSVLEDPLVRLSPSGLVSANGRQRLTYTCQLNLFKFPFDVQRCNITFSSMCCDEKYIKIAKVKNSTILSTLTDQSIRTEGEWKLTNVETIEYTLVRGNSRKSILLYSVTFKRKPFLYVINLIMPLLFLLVLDLASFFISEARGEKLGFKVTVLLSIFVLLLILKDILPSTEDSLPMMASYCVSVFTLVWVSVLETMLVNFLMDLDGFCGQEAETPEDDEAEIQQEANESAGLEGEDRVKTGNSCPPVDPSSDRVLLKRILDKVKAARQEAGRQNKDKTRPGCFRRLAKIIDAVFFVLYCTIVVISQISMFLLWDPYTERL